MGERQELETGFVIICFFPAQWHLGHQNGDNQQSR